MARVVLHSAVAGGAFWARLARELEQQGHLVQSNHAFTNAEYRAASSAGSRLWLRWKVYVWYVASTVSRLMLRRKYPESVVHIVTTNPFYLPLVIAWVAGWRSEKTVYLAYDLFPDAFAVGRWRWAGWLMSSLGWITRQGLRQSTVSVFLGIGIQKHAEKHYGAPELSLVIPVGADGGDFAEHPPRLLAREEMVNVVYVGILGRMHDVKTVEGLLAAPLPLGIEMTFYASGSGYRELCQKTRERDRLLLSGPLGDADWVRCLRSSQVGLITLEPGAEKVAMPSKSYSALVAGQAIIAVCPINSDLADLVREHDCGWVVPCGDVDRLREVLETVAADRELLHQKRLRAFQAGHAYYDMAPVCSRWGALLRDLTIGSPRAT
jgi:glycosyltransferase involved in cell wall biosynthesis